jgi:hypothetical protein
MRVVLSLLFALAAPNIALAQQAPNQTDLKAAYCIPVVEQRIKVLVSGIENPSVTMSAEDYAKLAKVLDQARTDMHRLQLYFAPRLEQLDQASLMAARKRGLEDVARGSRDQEACLGSFQEAGRLSMCLRESEASIRAQACNDLSNLPF